MKSRRQFIQRCSSALLGATVVPSIGLAARAPRGPTFTAFSAQLNTAFTLTTAEGRTVVLTLAKADPYLPKNRPELAEHRNFTLKFASAETQELESGSYAFRHPVLGALDIFVVPNHATATGLINYSATFHGAPVVA
ncbi:MAG: hypothetical protein JWO89_1584 [Verrucomicrobiaceae bacterium]|nr:hypothetical protein [Verrucomicrobiaceae bacterium]